MPKPPTIAARRSPSKIMGELPAPKPKDPMNDDHFDDHAEQVEALKDLVKPKRARKTPVVEKPKRKTKRKTAE